MTRVRLLDPGKSIDWSRLLGEIGADPGSLSRLVNRDRISVLLVQHLRSPAASILKQCMLSGGADALVHREVLTCKVEYSDAVVYGTPSTIIRGCLSLKGQPFGLAEIGEQLRSQLEPAELPESLTVNGVRLTYSGSPLIMGILNITPDSFSDGGKFTSPEIAARHAIEMRAAGASIIDVGGESTRPGSEYVSSDEQIARVIPVIQAIRAQSDVPISVDTRLPQVARAAIEAGAGLINSVDGLESPGMAEAAIELDVPVCIMHMQGNPETMQKRPDYRDAPEEVADYLLSRVDMLEGSGLARDRILVDPGIGFGKKLEHNVQLLKSLQWLGRRTGCRVLLGHSRKSFLAQITGIEQASERDAMTHVVTVLTPGADILRVHDVAGTRAALDVLSTLGGEK